MNLRKFPVIAPDGTEYRVKIEEWQEPLDGRCLSASLYVPRKRWGFRKLFVMTLYSYRDEYDPDNVEYVAVAREVVAKYYARLAAKERWAKEKAEAAKRKQAAIDRFNAWDGRVDV